MRYLLLLLVLLPLPVSASETLWQELRAGPAVLLMRHEATEPGTGDPPGFRREDCSTQRNLSEAGRAAARATGARLRAEGVPVAAVRTSAWCRSAETARLLGFDPPSHDQVLDSFFADRLRAPEATAALRGQIATWQGPGVLILVTHQVNITAATNEYPAPGEMVVLKPSQAGFTVVGRLRL